MRLDDVEAARRAAYLEGFANAIDALAIACPPAVPDWLDEYAMGPLVVWAELGCLGGSHPPPNPFDYAPTETPADAG
jgi:hypothetical protein